MSFDAQSILGWFIYHALDVAAVLVLAGVFVFLRRRLRDWQVEELAVLFHRRPETVRQDYLRPLLAQQRIAMTIPDKPKSPQQAYRAVEDSGL